MHIETVRIKNFRRLKDVRIDFEQDISIFVGANNSGKTSAAHAMALFLGDDSEAFTVHDFSADTWAQMNAFGNNAVESALPTITLDLWLSAGAGDLHRAFELLPSVSWEGSTIGVRIEFGATDPATTLQRFQERRALALAPLAQIPDDGTGTKLDPSPRDMREFLSGTLKQEFAVRYFVLDRTKFDNDFVAHEGYVPQKLEKENGRGGREILKSLIKVDMLYAQRHLSDAGGSTRAQDLTKRIGHIYGRNAADHRNDVESIKALMNAQKLFNDHLDRVFKPFLEQVGQLGYPGVTNPKLVIKSSLDPVVVLASADGAQVYYALNAAEEGELTLPDRYNGLGYKNLIYMVIELFDLHSQWLETKENRPPLHLVFIEEPEAHLHMQLQQVFIREVLSILAVKGEDAATASSQVVVTTHSSHIVYERGFVPIRYFRRQSSGASQNSKVLNLSRFHKDLGAPKSDFLVRYMKLTHCDLFFADAAVLVEGNVERILLPQMLDSAAKGLRSAYLSILEVGGAYAHIFRSLIEFLGITALVITDIDSVHPPAAPAAPAPAPDGTAPGADAPPQEQVDGDGPEEDQQGGSGTACVVATPNALTSNATLINWLPKKAAIADLLAASEADRTQARVNDGDCHVRVAYQTATPLTWNGVTENVVGRTLEEAFALENFAWTQHPDRKALKLGLKGIATSPINVIVEKITRKVNSSGFKKTSFALALLEQDPGSWAVPTYIREGLVWLAGQVTPAKAPGMPPAPDDAGGIEIEVQVEAVPTVDNGGAGE